MTKISGNSINNLIDLFQGQPPVLNNRKAYSGEDAGFRKLVEGEISGCKNCLHRSEFRVCKIVDIIRSDTVCNFQKMQATGVNNIIMDIEDLIQ